MVDFWAWEQWQDTPWYENTLYAASDATGIPVAELRDIESGFSALINELDNNGWDHSSSAFYDYLVDYMGLDYEEADRYTED